MRRTAFVLTGVLFYAAPVGAGLTGTAYLGALAFAGLFFLWVLVMRANPFSEGLGMVLPALMLHFALASALVGFGHLIRAVTRLDVSVPLSAWLALGLAALAAGRLAWEPQEEAQAERLAERALKALSRFAEEAGETLDAPPDLPIAHPTEMEAEALATAYGRIELLPADLAGPARLAPILDPLKDEVRVPILMEAFVNRAARQDTRRDRLAALHLASDGALAWRDLEARRMAEVFDLIVEAADTVALGQFLAAATDQIDAFPTTAQSLPKVARLIDIADQIAPPAPELSAGLLELARRIEDLAERNPNG